MKLFKIIIFLFFITSPKFIFSQSDSRLSLELGLGSLNNPVGIAEPYNTNLDFSFFDKFELGFQVSQKKTIYLGLQRINQELRGSEGYSFGISKLKGFEIIAGYELHKKHPKKFYISYAFESFIEFTTSKGTYFTDYNPGYEINHTKLFLGIGSEFKANYLINSKFFSDRFDSNKRRIFFCKWDCFNYYFKNALSKSAKFLNSN